jgi:hypothetical protein
MGEAKPVSKLGIYVPEARVKEIERWRDEINFSELFWRAFDTEVAKLIREKNMTKESAFAVQRFSGIVTTHSTGGVKSIFAEGYKTGREWATTTAHPDELSRLAARFESRLANPRYPWDAYLLGLDRDPPAELVETVLGRKPNRREVAKFWQVAIGGSVTDDRLSDAFFLHGFVAGAVGLWKEVRDAL